MQNIRAATVSHLADFDEIIDVRSPAEFAEDHIPGAINAPVLDNLQRIHIGTLYKQVSPFAAKKEGAALIARNVATHLETLFIDQPKSWRPLIYCWRGGQRSGAMAHILAQVGWSIGKLEGGYKRYRQQVLTDLNTLPQRLNFRVLCGPTGSGKSRLLENLSAQNAQVLDLEKLAQHRGSLLGNLPDTAQPSQKMFDSQIWQTLRNFDPQRPIFVEAESQKIGQLSIPNALLENIRDANCIVIEAPLVARVTLLNQDYAHFLQNPALLAKKLAVLIPLHGRQRVEKWNEQIHLGAWDELVSELLTQHYDPSYLRSTQTNFSQIGHAKIARVTDFSDAELQVLAQQLIRSSR